LGRMPRIRAWAARGGIRIAAWHTDQGVCTVKPIGKRRALSAAFTSVRRHAAGALVVAKRDRLARDAVVAAGVEDAARSAGARVISADGAGNGDAPADGFMRTIVDGAAEYERALIRARTRRTLSPYALWSFVVCARSAEWTVMPSGSRGTTSETRGARFFFFVRGERQSRGRRVS
jgi:DNA invertase Pin-like site-specific DNA recombinase